LPAGICVADHVTQVLMNLLINAGDAVADIPARKPQIQVSTRREDDNAIVAVRDNGHGMDQDVMDHAFDEGFSTKATGQGLGLGLFLCKALVEGDGGKITLASELGTGTTVSFTVPLQPT
jgi:signal transduction histidine kinase